MRLGRMIRTLPAGNGDSWSIDRAASSAVDVLLAEFRMVRR